MTLEHLAVLGIFIFSKKLTNVKKACEPILEKETPNKE